MFKIWLSAIRGVIRNVPGNSIRSWSLQGYCSAVFAAIFVLLSAALPASAQTGGIAISGGFQNHYYKMTPGETLKNPEVYIVVFNHDNVATRIKLTPESPAGVEIRLAESDFIIPAGKERRVEVGIVVGSQAIPGDYVLAITAEIQRSQGTGIAVMGAVQQQARLTIMGEAGNIHVRTVDLFGKPINADIQVCRKEDVSVPCFISINGEVEGRVVPGVYTAVAFFNGVEIASKEFTLEANKSSDITLVGQTVFIRGFSALPNYHIDDGKVAFVNLVYTLENIYEPMPNSKATLVVGFNGKRLEEEQLISMPLLNKGSTDGSYKYLPSGGWRNGVYSFSMRVDSQGKTAAQSIEQKLEVTGLQANLGTNRTPTIVVIIVVLLIIGVLVLLRRRRRRVSE